MSKVEVWFMTEEQRQEYIKQHPIVPTNKERNTTFSSDMPDWKWRQEKAREASMKARGIRVCSNESL
jgi:hypothetical protein